MGKQTVDLSSLHLDAVLQALLESQGLQAIADAAAEAFGNPFWVVDLNSRYLTKIRGSSNKRLMAESRMGYVSNDVIAYTEKTNVRKSMAGSNAPYFFTDNDGTHTILTEAVKIEGTVVAYTSVIDENRSLDRTDADRMAVIAQIVGTELEKNTLYRDNKEIMYSYFLTDLLDRRIPFEDIHERLAVIGYQAKKYAYLLNVDLSALENRRVLLSFISSQISMICTGSIGCLYQNHYVYLFTTAEKLNDRSYIPRTLRNFLKDANLCAALSSPFENLAEVPDNYQKTMQAIYLGKNIASGEVLFRYSALVVEQALSLVRAGMSYRDFSGGAIGRLADYDRDHHTDLIRTLQEYLLHVENVNRAAEALAIHPNTLRQRMDKIRDLTGVDFENGHQVFELTLALYLYVGG